MSQFAWVEMYEEIAAKLLDYENKQSELIALIQDMLNQGLKPISPNDRDKDGNQVLLQEIDPFTFFSSFNRDITPKNRSEILAYLKQAWNLKAEVPTAFEGIPTTNNQSSWFFPYVASRKQEDIPNLWKLAWEAVTGEPEQLDQKLFDTCLQIKEIGIKKLTMGLFWLCPDKFIPVDKNNQAFFKAKGIELVNKDAAGYFSYLKQISTSLGRDYPEFSRLAYEQHLSKASNQATVQAENEGSSQVPKAEKPRFWWLNANPKVWNLEEAPLGWKQTYTTHTEQGNKRQKPQSFQNIKPGDRIIGYMTSPQQEIVAVCELTQGVHDRDGQEVIEFQKIEEVSPPFPRKELKKYSLLAESEVLKNPQGSLIDLTEEEYRFIYSLLSQRQETSPALAPYTITEAKAEIFLPEAELNDIVSHLDTKKNIILQGPPGVGKTFVAKRLAYLKMKEKDDSRVEMVQFHQSYSYEDFIQGFRPNGNGGFSRKDGIFHRFCHKARQDAGRDYFFIIDEINRGNLSRIFGELMMLIEHDKRGQKFALPLTYHEETDERFFIPENLHLIGTMNTADRSLALVDYALRRRFAFVDIKPRIGSPEFESHLATEGVSPEVITWIRERVSNLNGEIAKDTRSLGEGFQIGHSYFCHYSKAKEVHQPEAWFKQVIEGEILPLLKEYWMDQPNEIKKWRAWLLEGK